MQKTCFMNENILKYIYGRWPKIIVPEDFMNSLAIWN